MNSLHKNKHNLLIWGLMTLFFFVGPTVKDELTITEGRPSQIGEVNFDTPSLIYNSVDRCEPTSLNGQNVYKVWGWSFIPIDKDQTNFDKYLVLKSNKTKYLFVLKPYIREGLQEIFKNIDIDLHNTGYYVYIAKEALSVGTYRIGFLYIQKISGQNYYQETSRMIIRTPNLLYLAN